jgi:hypothetical protein
LFVTSVNTEWVPLVEEWVTPLRACISRVDTIVSACIQMTVRGCAWDLNLKVVYAFYSNEESTMLADVLEMSHVWFFYVLKNEKLHLHHDDEVWCHQNRCQHGTSSKELPWCSSFYINELCYVLRVRLMPLLVFIFYWDSFNSLLDSPNPKWVHNMFLDQWQHIMEDHHGELHFFSSSSPLIWA